MIMKNLFILLTVLLLCACNDLFEYHPYDGRISGETGINAKNTARIENTCAGKTHISFIMTGDTQRRYDETEDFVKSVNRRDDIDFVIHGGDISDFGLTKEFMWMRDIMNGLKIPYVVLIGNHDCLANGKEIYRGIFGEENFSFLAGDCKFVCLNTNSLEYDYSHPVPDFTFIENSIGERRAGHERTVIAVHAPPLSEQFDNNVSVIFQHFIKRFPALQFCLNAHEHGISVKDRFDDGVIYYGSPSIEKRQYLLFTLTPEGYDYEVVRF
ncbi:MAG: metallophosphoesterase [Prevotellaceae bacterium]|nr:metallophosphoesterase [Prevotellaceae bacterium]